VTVMRRLVSRVTGSDPVTRFRDSETISAPETAFSGATPSRGLATPGRGESAKPLCLRAETHKARRIAPTGPVCVRDGFYNPSTGGGGDRTRVP